MIEEEMKSQARMKQALAGVTGGSGPINGGGNSNLPNPLQSPFGSSKSAQSQLNNPFTRP